MGFIELIIGLLFWLGMAASFLAAIYVGGRVALRCRNVLAAFLVGLILTPAVGMTVGFGMGHILDQFSTPREWMTVAFTALILHIYVGPVLGLFVAVVCSCKVEDRQVIRGQTKGTA